MTSQRRIRVLIVDDEALGRRGIRTCLARAPDVVVVGERANGRQAVQAIRELRPDVLFLDVQMPGMDGFDVVAAVGAEAMPLTVFVTAHDQHAVRAFDAQALDYVLKPIDDDRFDRMLDRVRDRVAERGQIALASRFARALEEISRPAGGSTVDRIRVRTAGRVNVVPVGEIDWIEAAGDYVRLHAGAETHLLRETMAGIEGQLDSTRFVRIHRSTIVNIDRVRELKPDSHRRYAVVLRNGTHLGLSRGYRERVAALFGGRL